MSLRSVAVWAVRAAAILCAVDVWSQTLAPQNPSWPSPSAEVSRPDACQLMPQSDLEAVFPDRPVTPRGATLSPAYKGPQYAQSCMYMLTLPSPDFKGDVSRFASVTIVQWGVHPDGKNGSAETFAIMSATREKLAADPALGLRVEPLRGLGDEAFAEISRSTVAIHVRKADLVFVVRLDNDVSPVEPIAVALAGRVAERWSDRSGRVEAARP